MYRVILIDDEDEVREGIKLKTNWEACGFQLAGDFGNGRDALEAMDELRPDAVITDICMPFMDGLELTERLTQRFRDVKVVIVTGYEDFDYAQQAIRLKVKDYLLKPINAAEFTAFLQKMKLELDAERQSKEDLSFLRRQFNESFPLLRERFLERLVSSSMKREDIERKFQYFGLTLPGGCYSALVGDIDEFVSYPSGDQDGEELLRFAAFNIMHEIFEKESGGVVFRTRDDKLVALLSGEREELPTRCQTLAEYARTSIYKYLKLTVSFGIGRMCFELPQLSKSYQEALSALDYRFLLGKNRIIFIGDLEYGKGIDSAGCIQWEKQLLSAVKTGKSEMVTHILQQWMEELRTPPVSMQSCYGKLHRLLVAFMNLLVEAGFEEAAVLGDDSFSRVTSMKTLDDVQAWLEGICQRIIAVFSDKRSTVTQSQMDAATAYIQEHFADEQLSLQQVCSHIYMSMSYFSSLFKQHTGETFVEYLTRLRMEKAKELLAVTQLKTYDIAARVGYGDPQYFSVIFKRNTGMTPKEFRGLTKGTA